MNQKQSTYILITLLAIALLWNLGLTPILSDEPTRTIVAQELDFNNNLIVPTINGELYYNKPPVYNWIILAFYKTTGSKSEFISRLPVVLSIFLFIGTLFYWCKKYMTNEKALLVGLIFATGSRLLFYDSLLGLIDVFFGWMILLTFILTYELEKKQKYTLLFVSTYAVIAVCFLMKGLQAIAFQGMTLLVWLTYKKQFKQLIRLPHFIGLITFISIVGLFLWEYNQYNPLDTLMETLWTESSKRTVGTQAWYNDLVHIVTFPVKNILADIFPWGLLLLFLLKPKVRKQVLQHDINKFALITFLANIIVYWLSPETRGRYLFPHYALLSIICVSICYTEPITHIVSKAIQKIIPLTIISITVLTALALGYCLLISNSNHLYTYTQDIQLSLILLLPITIVCYMLIDQLPKYYPIVILLILGRLIFDVIIIPYRHHFEPFSMYKREAIRIAQRYNDKPLIIYKSTPIDHSTSHYFMVEQERTIPHAQAKNDTIDAYYLFQKYHLETEQFEILDSFPQNWENQTIYIGY